MVDANGGYTAGQARRVGAALDDLGVVWFEEPVSAATTSTGLAAVRAAVRCDVAAGEYAADLYDAAPAVPGGGLPATGRHPLRRLHRLAPRRRRRPGAQPAGLRALRPRRCTRRSPPPSPNLRHVEWFIDHARLEPLLVDGAPTVPHGALQPNDDEPGHGMTIGRAGRLTTGRHTTPGHHDFGTPAEPPIGGTP